VVPLTSLSRKSFFTSALTNHSPLIATSSPVWSAAPELLSSSMEFGAAERSSKQAVQFTPAPSSAPAYLLLYAIVLLMRRA